MLSDILSDIQILHLVRELEDKERQMAKEAFDPSFIALGAELGGIVEHFDESYKHATEQERLFRQKESAQRASDVSLMLSAAKIIISVGSSAAAHIIDSVQEGILDAISSVTDNLPAADVSFTQLYEAHSGDMHEKLEEKFDSAVMDALSIDISGTNTTEIVRTLNTQVNTVLGELNEAFANQYSDQAAHDKKMLDLVFKCSEDLDREDPTAKTRLSPEDYKLTIQLKMQALLKKEITRQYAPLKERVRQLKEMGEAIKSDKATGALERYFQRRLTADYADTHYSGKRFSRTLGHRLSLLFPNLVAQRVRTPTPLISEKMTGRTRAEYKEAKSKAKYELTAGPGFGEKAKSIREAIIDELKGPFMVTVWNNVADELRLSALKEIKEPVKRREAIRRLDTEHREDKAYNILHELPATSVDTLIKDCPDIDFSEVQGMKYEQKLEKLAGIKWIQHTLQSEPYQQEFEMMVGDEAEVERIQNIDKFRRILRAKAIYDLPATEKPAAIRELCEDEGVVNEQELDEAIQDALTTPNEHDYDDGVRDIPWSRDLDPNAKDSKTGHYRPLTEAGTDKRPATAFGGKRKHRKVHPAQENRGSGQDSPSSGRVSPDQRREMQQAMFQEVRREAQTLQDDRWAKPGSLSTNQGELEQQERERARAQQEADSKAGVQPFGKAGKSRKKPLRITVKPMPLVSDERPADGHRSEDVQQRRATMQRRMSQARNSFFAADKRAPEASEEDELQITRKKGGGKPLDRTTVLPNEVPPDQEDDQGYGSRGGSPTSTC